MKFFQKKISNYYKRRSNIYAIKLRSFLYPRETHATNIKKNILFYKNWIEIFFKEIQFFFFQKNYICEREK